MVFLFNVGGYYIVFWGLRFQAEQHLDRRLDANLYDTGETIELKIPMVLPYPIQTREFERVDGKFEHQGEFFKLVKHKLHNDTLYVVCIRDHATRQLVNTLTDYVQLIQAIPGTDAGQKALNYLNKLVKDFCARADTSLVCQSGYSRLLLFSEARDMFIQRVVPVHVPPPKA